MTDLILLVVGLAVGAIGTLVGAGGGFLLVPIMLFLYPDDLPSVITSTSLAVVLINAASGSAAYARQGRIDFKTGLVLGGLTVPGSILGAVATHAVERGPFTIIFSLVLIAIAALLFARPVARESAADTADAPGKWRRMLVDRRGQVYMYAYSVPKAAAACLVIGFISSLLGIGGGFILVPLFILAFGFPTYIATATSQFMLVVMAFSGTATHIAAGTFSESLSRTLILAPGVIIGSQLGAWLSRRMRPPVIARLLAVMMTLAAGRLLLGELL